MHQHNTNRRYLQIMRDQAWGFVFGFLGLIVALASLIFAIPQAAPIRSGIAQTFSGTPAPTDTPTATPTSIPTVPPLASAETISENIGLKCNNCSDPLVVTITSIKVEPQNNRMIWSVALNNTSQNGFSCDFDKFSLQSSLDDQIFDATGDIVANTMCNSGGGGIGAGETYSTSVTFSFIPYTKIPYTLTTYVSSLNASEPDIPFLPVQVTF